jgi:hypothetical protein
MVITLRELMVPSMHKLLGSPHANLNPAVVVMVHTGMCSLSRSTLGLGPGSWLVVANNSALSLNDSRLVFNTTSGW